MKLLICGDFTTHNRGLSAVNNGIALSDEIIAIIHESDLSIINLEAPVVVDETTLPILKHGPALRTTTSTVSYLRQCGFDAVTLANNHFYDYGDKGVVDTLNTLMQNNMKHVGGGRIKDEKYTPLIYEKPNETVCILNYCEHEFSVGHTMGSNAMDEIQMWHDITRARAAKQFVVVIIHGGHELYQLPSPRMKRLYRWMIDIGAHVVVNHHQHCYSGYEAYHDGMIFYGLGNFFFDSIVKHTPSSWNEGYMVEIDTNNDTLNSYKLHPYKQCYADNVSTRLMTKLENEKFVHEIEKLNHVIANERLLAIEFEKFIASEQHNYHLWLSPYANRWLIALFVRKLLPSLLNTQKKLWMLEGMMCESHRDAIITLLKKSFTKKA
jgi:poly-gamma-glutamate synthesis protein (capsule biosynthesis protein)